MEFPTIVYKVPGRYKATGGKGKTYDYAGAKDQNEFDALISSGWFETISDAQEAQNKPIVPVVVSQTSILEDTAAPTRIELETKATELGIKFDGRTTDNKLSEKINEVLKG